MTTCAHCLGPQRGSAQVNDSPLCHPNDGMDCYHLATVYGHAMPCNSCCIERVKADCAASGYDDFADAMCGRVGDGVEVPNFPGTRRGRRV